MTIRSRKKYLNGNSTSYSQLENRHLLSADLAIEPLGSAVTSAESKLEFAEVQWKGESLLAKTDQWLIWQENQEGIQSKSLNSLKVGDELTVGDKTRLSFSASSSDVTADQKLQVTDEIASGLFVLSGTDNFSYELVAELVAAWMPNAVVEPDFKINVGSTPNDTNFGQLWGLNNTGQSGGLFDADIDAVEAWDITTGSSEVVVGVIDTGIDYNHPDLVDNIWTNPGEIAGDGIDNDGNGFIDDIHGWDFRNNDNDPMDDEGHGTHVAGTIGAVGNNNLGVVGVSQDVSLVAIKFLGPDGGSTSGAIRAIEYANTLKRNGTNIVMTNNSWGGGNFSFSLEAAIENALELDILFVAAAGNEGTSGLAYPASYDLDNVISVAATDRNDQLASFSNYNATRVDLAAPGVSILSTQPNNSYAFLNGTSMASPHVAGALALLAANEPNLTALELKAKLLDRVDVLPQLNGLVATSGRLNVNSLLEQFSAVNFTAETFVTPGSVGIDVVDETGFDLGATVTIVSSSGDSETLTIDATTALEFSTAIDAVAGVANADDGILQVASGDTLTVTYFDPDHDGGVTRSDSAVIFADDHGNDSASATSVDFPFTVSGNIEVSDDLDWFSFRATAGMEYEFRVALGSLTNSVLSLYGTDGSSLLESDNSSSSSITWIAPSSGNYFVSVSHLSNNSGTYDLSGTSAIPESTVDFNAAAFLAPTTVGLQLTDPTGFAAGATVMIETSSGDVETLAITATGSFEFSTSIDSVEGAAIANDGILQIASNETITATYVDADNGFGGTFTATNAVTIFADDHGNEATNATAVGSPFDVSGNLDRSGDADWFRFDAVAGLLYEFETTLSGLSDSTLRLYGTNGTTLLAYNDDGGVGLASRIVWEAPESGSYYLAVRAYNDNKVGGYQLTGSAASSVVLDVIAGGTDFSSDFIDSVDGGGAGAGNGLGYSLVGDHQLQSIPWLNVNTIYVQFSDDVSASIAAGDILLTGSRGDVYDMEMVAYHTESNTAEFLVNDDINIDSFVISIMDGAVGNTNGGLLDGEWNSGQTESSGNGNVGGQFDFFFNVLPGDEDGSGQVNSGDAFAVFASNTQAASDSNYRRDIDGSGQINSGDAFAAFAYNTMGLPVTPTAPLSPAATVPATKISLADNDDFFEKELSSLKVEDFEASQETANPAAIDSVSLAVVSQPSPLILAASDLGLGEPSENESLADATPRQEIALSEEAVQSFGSTLQAFETPDLSDTDSEKEQRTSTSKQRFSADTDLLDSVIGTLSGEQVKTLF